MSKTYIYQLLFFVGAMVLLNYFFDLNISILGSLAITLGLYLAFSMARPGYG